MIKHFYSIYDSKAEYYATPVLIESRGAAIRMFATMVNEVDHQFNKYPEDYVLFELGDWDEETGVITPHSAPISLGVGSNYKRSGEPQLQQVS